MIQTILDQGSIFVFSQKNVPYLNSSKHALVCLAESLSKYTKVGSLFIFKPTMINLWEISFIPITLESVSKREIIRIARFFVVCHAINTPVIYIKTYMFFEPSSSLPFSLVHFQRHFRKDGRCFVMFSQENFLNRLNCYNWLNC